METEFYKLAVWIEENIARREWYICNILPAKELDFFIEYFKPTDEEIANYKHGNVAWMSSESTDHIEANNFRILALLLCDQIYKTNNKA